MEREKSVRLAASGAGNCRAHFEAILDVYIGGVGVFGICLVEWIHCFRFS